MKNHIDIGELILDLRMLVNTLRAKILKIEESIKALEDLVDENEEVLFSMLDETLETKNLKRNV